MLASWTIQMDVPQLVCSMGDCDDLWGFYNFIPLNLMSVLEKGFIPGYFSIVYALYNNELQNKFHWFHEDLRNYILVYEFWCLQYFQIFWTKLNKRAVFCLYLLTKMNSSRNIFGMILKNMNLFWHNPVVNWMKLVYQPLIVFYFLYTLIPLSNLWFVFDSSLKPCSSIMSEIYSLGLWNLHDWSLYFPSQHSSNSTSGKSSVVNSNDHSYIIGNTFPKILFFFISNCRFH